MLVLICVACVYLVIYAVIDPFYQLLKTTYSINIMVELMLLAIFDGFIYIITVLVFALILTFFQYIKLYSILFNRKYFKVFKILLTNDLYSYDASYWRHGDLILLINVLNRTGITIFEYFEILNIMGSPLDNDKLLILFDLYGEKILFIALVNKFYEVSMFLIHQKCSLQQHYINIIRFYDNKAFILYNYFTRKIKSNLYDNVEM